MNPPLLVILMGSKADLAHAQAVAKAAENFGLECSLHIGSAHKTPEHVLHLLHRFEADPRPKVYITIAGRSNALSGFTDAAVSSPVIACPPPSETFGGADIYSSLRMPSGVAPAVVLDPANAALLAAKIFALSDPVLREKVQNFQRNQAEKILQDETDLQA